MSIGKQSIKLNMIKFLRTKYPDCAYVGNLKDKSNKEHYCRRLEAFLKGQGYSETVARQYLISTYCWGYAT